MFNERARAYKKHNVALIVIPRASGMNLESWKIAGAMASLVSGAYVASSNRVGNSAGGTHFGGGGYAYAPEGRLLALTSAAGPLQIFELDPQISAAAQREYPCYVPEIE
jgi:N-carbamoylputrescine amidase